jgi:hypothetical protein
MRLSSLAVCSHVATATFQLRTNMNNDIRDKSTHYILYYYTISTCRGEDE